MRLFFATLIGFILLTTASQASPVVLPTATGKITSFFGVRRHPIFKRSMMHKGIDFKAKRNEVLYSVSFGVVKSAGNRGSFGNAVEIYYPDAGASALYAHLNSLKVKTGEIVDPGEPIGLAGSTGRSTGPHLHFEMRSKGTAIDPEKFFAKAAVIQGGLPKPIAEQQPADIQTNSTLVTEPASMSTTTKMESLSVDSSDNPVAARTDNSIPLLSSEPDTLPRLSNRLFDVFAKAFSVIASAIL